MGARAARAPEKPAPIQTTAGTCLAVPAVLVPEYRHLSWAEALASAEADPRVVTFVGNEYSLEASAPETAILHRIYSPSRGAIPGLLRQNY